MNDRFGKELEMGQKVLHVYNTNSRPGVRKMWVVGFTEKMVKLSRKPEGASNNCTSTNCVILEEG